MAAVRSKVKMRMVINKVQNDTLICVITDETGQILGLRSV